ncbi:hypothetical protein [Agarivorans sp. DSG3-1]|uniref:hypothetical protein n=1 Tax=Agarivorans sp. DSG3-1 TaxID=3342249 RepID=UPI00398F81A9
MIQSGSIVSFSVEALGIIGGVLGLIYIIYRMKALSFANGMKHFEVFKALQQLCGSDARDNMPSIRVALSCVTSRDLSSKEIEWFLYTPGAFRYLKRYGKFKRYIDIDFDKNLFKFVDRYSTRKSRWIEAAKLVSIYAVTASIGIMMVTEIPLLVDGGMVNRLAGFHLAGYFFIAVSLLFMYMALMFQQATFLVDVELPKK